MNSLRHLLFIFRTCLTQLNDIRQPQVMEDNDPTGYKSTSAVAAKEAANIKVIEMPPPSPDLEALDGNWQAHNSTSLRKGTFT